ncbi:MAG: hypothetical protein EZS28_019107 [Streblomastix strix]|uniref:Uncharacterized protein n=1 Tax=Streblomastix strix TaxID=222440 RepID=A0A5J4VT28_9EUKA|nr:MAG: hypothetical protein EZS28_019107 [Streblomastix strix]
MATADVALLLETFISRSLQEIRTTFNLPVWEDMVPFGLELRISSQIVVGLVVDVRQPEKPKKMDVITEGTLSVLKEQLQRLKDGGVQLDFASAGSESTDAIVALSRMALETRDSNFNNKYLHYELHKDLTDATIVFLVFVALPKEKRNRDLYQSGWLLRGGEQTVYTIPYNTNDDYHEQKDEILQRFNDLAKQIDEEQSSNQGKNIGSGSKQTQIIDQNQLAALMESMNTSILPLDDSTSPKKPDIKGLIVFPGKESTSEITDPQNETQNSYNQQKDNKSKTGVVGFLKQMLRIPQKEKEKGKDKEKQQLQVEQKKEEQVEQKREEEEELLEKENKQEKENENEKENDKEQEKEVEKEQEQSEVIDEQPKEEPTKQDDEQKDNKIIKPETKKEENKRKKEEAKKKKEEELLLKKKQEEDKRIAKEELEEKKKKEEEDKKKAKELEELKKKEDKQKKKEQKNESQKPKQIISFPTPNPRQHSPPPTSDIKILQRVKDDEQQEQMKVLMQEEEIKVRQILMEEEKIKEEEEDQKLKEQQRIEQEEKMRIEEELIRKKKEDEERRRIEEIEQQRIKKEQEEKLKQETLEIRMKRLDELKQQSQVRAQNKASREQRKIERNIREQQRKQSEANRNKREEERKQEEQELIKEHEQNEIIRQQEEQKRKMSEEVRKFNKEQRDENKRERERKRKEIRDKQEERNKELEQDKENKKKAQVILEQLLIKEKSVQDQGFLPNPVNEKEKEQSQIHEIVYRYQTNQILEELAKFGSAALDLGIGCEVDGDPLHANVTQPGVWWI